MILRTQLWEWQIGVGRKKRKVDYSDRLYFTQDLAPSDYKVPDNRGRPLHISSDVPGSDLGKSIKIWDLLGSNQTVGRQLSTFRFKWRNAGISGELLLFQTCLLMRWCSSLRLLKIFQKDNSHSSMHVQSTVSSVLTCWYIQYSRHTQWLALSHP